MLPFVSNIDISFVFQTFSPLNILVVGRVSLHVGCVVVSVWVRACVYGYDNAKTFPIHCLEDNESARNNQHVVVVSICVVIMITTVQFRQDAASVMMLISKICVCVG